MYDDGVDVGFCCCFDDWVYWVGEEVGYVFLFEDFGNGLSDVYRRFFVLE